MNGTAGALGRLARFVAVAFAGFALDIGVATALALGVGTSLGLAAAAGFACGLGANYLMHALWTFRDAGRPVSLAGLLSFAGASLIALAVRLAALAALQAAAPPALQASALLLVAAAGVSMAVNFMVLRASVFAPRTPTGGR